MERKITMANLRGSEEMQIWEKARKLTRELYICLNQNPFAVDFELRIQMRKATVAIISNLVEAFAQTETEDFICFLEDAKISVAEVNSHLADALVRGHIDNRVFSHLSTLAHETHCVVSEVMDSSFGKFKW